MFGQISILAPQINDLVSKSSRILINVHAGTDYDSVGSAFGLKLILENMGKKVDVYSPEPIDSEIRFKKHLFPGFEDIIYGKFSDLRISDYQLFFCLDSEDPRRISRTEEITFPLPVPTIVIDHHEHNPGFGDINLIADFPTCTSEMVYHLAKTNSWVIPPAAAVGFFTGIWSDTGQFMYPGTTSPRTFQTIAELLDLSGTDVSNLIWTLRSQDWKILKAAGWVISQGKMYFNEKVFYSFLDFEDIKNFGLPELSMDPVKEFVCHSMSYTRGPSIIALLYQKGQNRYKLSLRSNNQEDLRDVSLIAKKIKHGGGHPRAAGVDLDMDKASAQKLVLKTIAETFPELGEA